MSRLLTIAIPVLAGMASSAQSDWDLRRDKDGIVIYTKTPEDNPLKEYRVYAEIDNPLVMVYTFLTDIERRPEWVINCMDVDIIERSGNRSIYHTCYDIPWPMSDRDLVVECESAIFTDSGRAHILTVLSDYDYPPEEDAIRMERYREEVFLEAIAPGRTAYRVEGFADPGGKLPTWVVNMFLVDGIWDSVQRTREQMSGNK